MTISTLGIQAVSFLLFGSCAYLAVGGAFLSSAEVYFKLNNYEQAAVYSKRSLTYDRDNSEGFYLLGLSCWEGWLKTRNPEALAQADLSFEKLTRYHPRYAKGWFYRALAEKQRLLGQGVLTVQDRLRINQEFEKAQALEPSSPWMMIHTSLERLEIIPENIKGEQTRLLLKRIRWALQQHYIHQASPYLEEVYRRLLKLGYDASVLRKVTPNEAESYFRLLEFYKLKRLYEAYSQYEPSYRVLRRKQNSRLCDQADGWLESGDARRAEAAYRFALGKLPLGARARAGQLSASGDDAQIGGEDILRSLESLLVQEEEDLSVYWDYLEPQVQASSDPFLEGLFCFRRGQFSEAVSAFETVHAEKHKSVVRRFLAQALIEMGRLEHARLVLKPLLSEDQPDVRELLLLERLADINSMAENQQIHEKIQKLVTRKILNPTWWSETAGSSSLLDEGELSGVSVNLQPGRVKAEILLKLEAGTSARLARVRIWENDRELFSGTAVVTPNWQRSNLEFETTGGWRWVQVMLEADSLSIPKQGEAAKLRLGSLQMDYPE